MKKETDNRNEDAEWLEPELPDWPEMPSPDDLDISVPMELAEMADVEMWPVECETVDCETIEGADVEAIELPDIDYEEIDTGPVEWDGLEDAINGE